MAFHLPAATHGLPISCRGCPGRCRKTLILTLTLPRALLRVRNLPDTLTENLRTVEFDPAFS